jgi:hypothetical protein
MSEELPFHMRVTEYCVHGWAKPVKINETIRLAGRAIDLSSLVPLYGSSATGMALDAISQAYEEGHLKRPYSDTFPLCQFMKFVAAEAVRETSPANEVFSEFSAGKLSNLDALTEMILRYVDRLRDVEDVTILRTTNLLTRNNHAEKLRSVLRALAKVGYTPQLGRFYSSICTRGQRGHILSIGEQSPSEPSGAAPMGTVMQRSKQRLDRLRAHLVEIFEEGWSAHERGAALRNRPDLASNDDLAKAVAELEQSAWRLRGSPNSPPLVERCFPRADIELATANLIKYITCAEGGLVTAAGREYKAWSQLVRACGGAQGLQDYIMPSRRTFTAAYAIVLLDTGFNVQPCDEILADPFLFEAKRGKQSISTITSRKLRAKGNPVIAALRDWEADVELKLSGGRTSSVTVIRRWREMSEPFRRILATERQHLADYLWLYPMRESREINVAPTMDGHWRNLMKTIASDPELSGLRITRQALRTTRIQLGLADGALDAGVAALLGNHSSSMTTERSYLSRGWFIHELDSKIREFQELFVDAIMSTGTALALGRDENSFSSRKSHAIETGLGFSCVERRVDVKQSERRQCEKYDHCHSCENVRFVPSSDAYRNLIFAERSLSAAAEQFISRNPERWARCWLPMLAMCRATISKIRESHRRRAFERAEADVEQAINEGGLPLLSPW